MAEIETVIFEMKSRINTLAREERRLGDVINESEAGLRERKIDLERTIETRASYERALRVLNEADAAA